MAKTKISAGQTTSAKGEAENKAIEQPPAGPAGKALETLGAISTDIEKDQEIIDNEIERYLQQAQSEAAPAQKLKILNAARDAFGDLYYQKPDQVDVDIENAKKVEVKTPAEIQAQQEILKKLENVKADLAKRDKQFFDRQVADAQKLYEAELAKENLKKQAEILERIKRMGGE